MIERSTVGSLLRCTQAYALQLSEKETLRYGIAYYALRFPLVADANQFREIMVEDRAQILSAVDEALTWFADHQLRCTAFAPALGQSPGDFALVLKPHGFEPRLFSAMKLVRWPQAESAPGIRVLPARAMRTIFQAMILEDTEPADLTARRALSEALTERMDDPPMDTFVALLNGKPAGRCSLFQVGDLARVTNFAVLPPYRGAGVDRALLHHALALAHRLAIKHILTQIDETLTDRHAFMVHEGFENDGEMVEFHLAGAGPLGDVR